MEDALSAVSFPTFRLPFLDRDWGVPLFLKDFSLQKLIFKLLQAIPCNLGEWQMWDIGKKEWYTNKARETLALKKLLEVGGEVVTHHELGKFLIRLHKNGPLIFGTRNGDNFG